MQKEIRIINYEQDIQSIKDIWKKNSSEEEEWENVDGEIKCTKNKTYVKVKNDLIVAFIVIRTEDGGRADNLENYIFELHAYPKHQGFGSELIKKMQAERQFLALHVKKTNDGAIGCYKKNGFTIGGQTQNGSKHYMVWEKQ